MLKNNFIVKLKSNNKILNEIGNEIHIPFSSEYSIILKNLNNRKAVISISLDGKDVLNGRRLIIETNKELELERFLINDLNSGNKFKFINKTKKIQEYRGDNIEDGILKVTFQLEKEIDTPHINNFGYPHYTPSWIPPNSARPVEYPHIRYDVNNQSQCTLNSLGETRSKGITRMAMSCCNVSDNISLKSDEGITVNGSISKQSFTYDSVNELEIKTTIITLQLKGYDNESNNSVKDIICNTCGTVNQIIDNHIICSECGTYLNI